ncbi:Qat anti-phage system QueC-like protein QatC [Collimonas sp. PA-H2]|uniref:Qat anti-phage system QueC-like protein QatC n=1 Tax=Collimonas sp. PA-H2 TaxID=1881062 RepID=UPI0026F45FBA|nr:Qat anti-phage system QueC-like protein QatC [Collimonas sp. PA-H2]
MYGKRPPAYGSTSIGGPVLSAVRRLGVPVHQRAFDLLTIAMAVTAADTFVDRARSDDGWTRQFQLRIPLIDPSPWLPVVPLLEKALHFLSGDLWRLDLLPGGPQRPIPQVRGRLTTLSGHDCVSLFSGGLDSAIGAMDLLANQKMPLLISHSYRGDAERQHLVGAHLPVTLSRFSAVANPVSMLGESNDVQMRTRSFNFIAYGTLVAATMAEQGISRSPVDLYVPENGLIALNPPLTFRRIGSLSTRTTHPHFLGLIQQILDATAIPVHISNPYALKTKGEMLAGCTDQATLNLVAKHTVSCGKWKRTNMQCGKCVPCLIRRASFFSAGMPDDTQYAPNGSDLSAVMASDAKDDLMAMILAARRLPAIDITRWIPSAGPLPVERAERDALLDVASRGMAEVKAYLDSHSLLA